MIFKLWTGAVSCWSPGYGTMELLTVNRFSLCPTTNISSCLGDLRPFKSILMHCVVLVSCLTLLGCCLYKCTVGKCEYSSAFVFHLIGMWVCWCVEEGFFFLAKVSFFVTFLTQGKYQQVDTDSNHTCTDSHIGMLWDHLCGNNLQDCHLVYLFKIPSERCAALKAPLRALKSHFRGLRKTCQL